jgi:hypothetical protein
MAVARKGNFQLAEDSASRSGWMRYASRALMSTTLEFLFRQGDGAKSFRYTITATEYQRLIEILNRFHEFEKPPYFIQLATSDGRVVTINTSYLLYCRGLPEADGQSSDETAPKPDVFAILDGVAEPFCIERIDHDAYLEYITFVVSEDSGGNMFIELHNADTHERFLLPSRRVVLLDTRTYEIKES